MSDWDRQTAPGGAEGPQWVSAAEAADVAGVTPGTVRYWARNGLIVSEVVGGPAGEKTLVRLDEVLQHARQEGPGRPPPASTPATGGRHSAPSEVVTDLPARTSELAPILKSIPEIMAQLTAATDRAARAETKVEFLSAQLADLRRRLAEAEEGRDGGAPVAAMPEVWESLASPEEPSIGEDARAIVVEDEPADVPGATGWPAPPAETLREELPDEPADDAEPGPETIDWTTGTTSEAPPALEEVPAATSPEPERSGDTLDDIWNQPAAPAEAVDPVGPVEPTRAEERARTGEAALAAGVDWHEPAGAPPAPPAPPGDEAPASVPRAANAPVPEGEDFYGPRRRRWFKRRR